MTPADERRNRDRDARGRALNSRPRDGLGRPLPRDSSGVERVPEGLTLPPAESLAEAQRLLDAGRPFHAHEVLEGTWKAAPDHERDLWQGLAQLAVGLTHLGRGNLTGAVRLLRRGAERIAPFADDQPYDVDVPSLVAYAEQTAARLESGWDPLVGPSTDRTTVPVPRLQNRPQAHDPVDV